MKPLNVIGLNSGTSIDGIDAALFHIAPNTSIPASPGSGDIPRLEIRMISSLLYPIDQRFQDKLKHLIASAEGSFDQLTRLNFALGETFADAALSLIKQSGIERDDIDLIGSHGQTIWHAPQERLFWGIQSSGTWQIGEPAVIAARTGVPVIADFRVQDMSYGGQGAPLVAFADQVLFGGEGIPTGILNLGGIANITVIDGTGLASMAFDTGPGNMIIDRAAQRLFKLDCDFGGKLALGGRVNQAWLGTLLKNPYFQLPPPKTTGRELFGYALADRLLDEAGELGISPHDIMATLTALTAGSIAQAYHDFIYPHLRLKRLILGGGGTENKSLTSALSTLWAHSVSIRRHEDFGISTKFKEALLFALLAYTTYFGIPNNVPICTGSKRRCSLGKLCRP